MKKEKTVRSYKRKTKSGKVVTVRQHTAKYDAAEVFKEALAKKGAGSELATKQLTEKELKQAQQIAEENSELDEEYLAAFYPELSPKMVKAVMVAHRAKSATPKAKAANTAGKSPKSETPDLGFTAEEYKAWYHWDMDKDPKNPSALKVKKALVAAMGPRAYRKYEDDMTDSYTARGDKKAFGAVGELVQARKDAYNAGLQEKTARAQKAVAEAYGATDAAAKHDARAKEQGAKKKEAKAKIGVLSPKKEKLPEVEGLFSKGNPFGRKMEGSISEAMIKKNLFGKLKEAGYKLDKASTSEPLLGYLPARMYKFVDSSGNLVYVECDKPSGRGKSLSFGRVQVTRGDSANSRWASHWISSGSADAEDRKKVAMKSAFQKFIAANDRNIEAMYRAQEKYGKKSEQYAKAKKKYDETRRAWKESPEYKAVKATGGPGLPATPRTRMESQRAIGSRKAKVVKQELDDFIAGSKYKGTLRVIQGYGQNEIAGRLIAKGASSKEAQSIAKKVSSLYSRYRKYDGMGRVRYK